MAKQDNRINTTTLKLKDILQEKDNEFHFKDDLFGMSFLTNPGYISANRTIMFTSHLRQFVNLKNPSFPKVFTNYENIVGKHSTGYYKAKHNSIVVDKIPKFADGVHDNHLYLLFTYDEKNDRYDVVEKKIVEDLTEKFGFNYNNEVLDTKEPGSKINKDEVLYKTPSYDEDMNYCYGDNVKFVYMLENYTIEDAIKVSKSFAKRMVSKEVETVKISLNDNDILCNIFGDNDIYKCIPDINDVITDKILCAKRRISNNQLLYDLKRSNLRKINYISDKLFFAEGRVVDINIYSNKTLDEIEDNNFNRQIINYLKLQKEFYTKVYNRCKEIIDSGSDYSKDINFYFQKAEKILNPNYKWKEENNSVFSNVVIEFLVERDASLSVGQKITGRYGNKGVTSIVCDDEDMPVLETGERIDVIFNTLGVINRLNSFQLMEQSINFICNRVRERLQTLSSLQDKEDLFFRIMEHFNPKQEKKLRKYYNKLSSSKKKENFFYSIIKKGIYVHIPPMWEEKPIFDVLTDIYKEFDWIKPYDVYVNRFGRRIKILKPLVVGDMYVIKLKQTSKKGFSVRATGSLSKKGIPEKSNKAKNHEELYSRTPIRIGDQEDINSNIGVDSKDIAELHMYYRSSVTGRRSISEQLATKTKLVKDFKHSLDFKNRNVEILQAYLKTMGLRIKFSDDTYNIDIYSDRIEDFDYNGKMYICTKGEFEDFKRREDIETDYKRNKCYVGTNEGYQELISKLIEEEELRENNYVINI